MFLYFCCVVLIFFLNYDSSSSKQLPCGMKNIGGGLSVGGAPAKSFESPWKIAIYRNDSKEREFKYKCGGVLINIEIVVTGE